VTLDAYSTHPHYAEHMRPVWNALPVELRGVWATVGPDPDRARRQLVANRFRGRPVVYVEHGAGQTYAGDERAAAHGSYSGGAGLDNVELFVCPSERVAARWRARYPSARTVVVGCPKLDSWHARPRQPAQLDGARPLVVLSWHWQCELIPETQSALRHYVAALPELSSRCMAAGASLVGHGHPRSGESLARLYGRHSVPYWRDSARVLACADVLVCDNSSLMYEAASLGIPVVALNAPWYRRDVEHGLRFWSHVPGVQVDEPSELGSVVLGEVTAPGTHAALRSRAVAEAYAYTDGQAAARAAAAIVELLA
jgi:hypothetical protein